MAKGHVADAHTRALVRLASGHGAAAPEIADALGVSLRVLKAHYADELAEQDRRFRAIVRLLAINGVPQSRIAQQLGMDPKTLRKRYRKELDEGALDTLASVTRSVVQQATNGNMTAAIFYLKTQGGWREGGLAPGQEPDDEVSPMVVNLHPSKRR